MMQPLAGHATLQCRRRLCHDAKNAAGRRMTRKSMDAHTLRQPTLSIGTAQNFFLPLPPSYGR